MKSAGFEVKRVLHRGPMDGEEVEMPDPPYPWFKIVVPDSLPIPTFESYQTPQPLRTVQIANYRLVRYTDGRLGYEYECMD